MFDSAASFVGLFLHVVLVPTSSCHPLRDAIASACAQFLLVSNRASQYGAQVGHDVGGPAEWRYGGPAGRGLPEPFTQCLFRRPPTAVTAAARTSFAVSGSSSRKRPAQ